MEHLSHISQYMSLGCNLDNISCIQWSISNKPYIPLYMVCMFQRCLAFHSRLSRLCRCHSHYRFYKRLICKSYKPSLLAKISKTLTQDILVAVHQWDTSNVGKVNRMSNFGWCTSWQFYIENPSNPESNPKSRNVIQWGTAHTDFPGM
jgi:hypothetical protein